MESTVHHVDHESQAKKKTPCRSCTDFKTWRTQMREQADKKQEFPMLSEKAIAEVINNCPLDKDQLGRNTWSFLHTMAANYPETPSETQRDKMKSFMNIFSEFYPCEPCAADLREHGCVGFTMVSTSGLVSRSSTVAKLMNGGEMVGVTAAVIDLSDLIGNHLTFRQYTW